MQWLSWALIGVLLVTYTVALLRQATDGDALCGFYSALTVKAELSSWKCQGSGPFTPCGSGGSSWYGVTCKLSGSSYHVVRLSLNESNLHGTIPGKLFELTALQYLDLSSNEFKGTLSSAVGQLRGLTWLDLWSNSLSGPIPRELF
jgi:hypothetical protein